MPSLPRGSCTFPGCIQKVRRGARCDQHQRPGDDSPLQRFYKSGNWRNARARVLREQPVCACPGCPKHAGQRCQQLATDVDHIVSMTDGGSMLDRSNLQGLCEPCHVGKTWADRARRAASSA